MKYGVNLLCQKIPQIWKRKIATIRVHAKKLIILLLTSTILNEVSATDRWVFGLKLTYIYLLMSST